MKKLTIFFTIILAGSILQAQQSFNLKLGLFYPSLASDLWEQNMKDLVFEKKDMIDKTFAAEIESFVHPKLSLSLEGWYYKHTHLSQYREWVDMEDNPIFQDFSLEILGLEASVKLYPIGCKKMIYPYFGGGVGIYHWIYKQWGDFVDEESETIQEDRNAETSTYSPGFHLKGGLAIRFQSFQRIMAFFFEVEYLSLKGELSSFFKGFEKVDLGGMIYKIGFQFFL